MRKVGPPASAIALLSFVILLLATGPVRAQVMSKWGHPVFSFGWTPYDVIDQGMGHYPGSPGFIPGYGYYPGPGPGTYPRIDGPGTPFDRRVPGREGEDGAGHIFGHRGDAHLGAAAVPADDPDRPAVPGRQARLPVRLSRPAEHGRARRQQRGSRPDLAEPRRAGVRLLASHERCQSERVQHVTGRIGVVDPDRQRQQACRIGAGGVSDSHEPWNCLAGTGHGLNGEGWAGRVYNGFLRRPPRPGSALRRHP